MKNIELTSFELSLLASAAMMRSLDSEDDGDEELATIYRDLYYKIRKAENPREVV